MSFNIQSLQQKAETRLFSEIKKAFGAPKPTAENVIKQNNQQRLFESARNAAFTYDIFLSHRAEDAQVILGLLDSLNDYGYTVYVDWKDDPQLDRTNVNKNTANILRERMNQSKSLLFATTENAGSSRWMPW